MNSRKYLLALGMFTVLTAFMVGVTFARPEYNKWPGTEHPNEWLIKLNDSVEFDSSTFGAIFPEVLNRWNFSQSLELGNNTLTFLRVQMGETEMDALVEPPTGPIHPYLENLEFVEQVSGTMFRGSSVQLDATWHIDRIDQTTGMDGRYSYTEDGSTVPVYVLDTGIRRSHSEFENNRAVFGYDVFGDNEMDDCNGHGTHVAGLVAGTLQGSGKDVTVISVRVLNCDGEGSNADVIAGLQYVFNAEDGSRPYVISMSLGGPSSSIVDSAVRASVLLRDGVALVAAAGNENSDACDTSPGGSAFAISVGSTDSDDKRSSFSNFGNCVDIFAPGSDVLSASYKGDDEFRCLSGTSMATPIVSGVAALILEQNPSFTYNDVRTQLINFATTGVLSDIGSGSPNLLLNTPFKDVAGLNSTPTGTPQEPCADSASSLFGVSVASHLLLLLRTFII